PRRKVDLNSYFWVVIQVVIITVIGYFGKDTLGLPNIGMLYLLPVLLASARMGMGPSVAAAILGVLVYDFFLVPPVLFLTVADIRYLITFTVFLLVAITTGTMANRLRYRISESRIREARTRALYDLAREIAAVTDVEQLSTRVVEHIARTLDAEAVVFIPEIDGVLKAMACSNPQSLMLLDSNETAVATWSYKQSQPTGNGTDTLPGAYGVYLPLRSEEETLGVLGIRPREQFLTPEQRSILDALCGLTALAIGRLRLAHEAQEVKNLEASEKLRTALFNSLSHDLKTPLASIIGSVASLLDEGDIYSNQDRTTLLATIKQGALRMNRVVGNLLDMARLESGLMRLNIDWCDIQDIIGVVLRQSEDSMEDRKIIADIPPSLPLVQADHALIEQVLTNLLDNAIKYSTPDSQVRISVTVKDQAIQVAIVDEGIGIPPGDEERVFDKFYRLNSMQNVSGTGLGLSICKSIVEAHGGSIWIENRTNGGCITSFTLPVPNPIPSGIISNKAGEAGAAKRGPDSGDR
ncbi:MAG: ATP-binding protein, partial [Chitinophagales bacterium]